MCVCVCMWRTRGLFPDVTFQNDTAAAEDLQQVVFKFPEFNKLLSREGIYSYGNGVASGSRGPFQFLDHYARFWNTFNRTNIFIPTSLF